MGKSFVIRCDMEGVSGVVSYEQVTPAAPEYALAREWFMAELLALIEGLQEGGAARIAVYDEHHYGRNIDIARLPRGVTAVCGKPPYRADWAGGLDHSFDGMILHGLHAKAGTPGALLPHSYELDIAEIRLSGVSVGEIGVEAAIAGDWDVPTLLCIADSAGAAEAEALLSGIATVATKTAQDATGAVCRSLGEVTEQIRETARSVVQSPPSVEPYRVAAPVELEIRLVEGAYLAAVQELFAERMGSADTLRIEAQTVTEAWAEYWQMKRSAAAHF